MLNRKRSLTLDMIRNLHRNLGIPAGSLIGRRSRQECELIMVVARSEPDPILGFLVEAYEAKRFVIEAPDPAEAIRFRMDQGGLTVKDLVPSIGQPNRAYEVLNRKRSLTLDMIRNLHHNLGIRTARLIDY